MFQRMNSYAIYRIAETIRVLLFMTLSILVFNFYPVTAIMIVLLAILNDGAILSIAYDRVRYSNAPESWDMPWCLASQALWGLRAFSPLSGFFTWANGSSIWTAKRSKVLMYLKLSVAGHLTIFVTRTRRPFWAIRPAADSILGGSWYPDLSDFDRRIWNIHGAYRLALGLLRLGICPDLVFSE